MKGVEYSELRLFFSIAGILFFTALGALFPRRKRQKAISWRLFHNLAFASFNPILIKLLLSVTLLGWAEKMQSWGWGILNSWEGPLWLEVTLVILIFDGFIYWQHRLTHSFPPLWRLHRVHHSDIEFDASTALRFHFLEIICSFFIKMGMIAVVGGPILGVFLFEVILNFSALFNHSNWALSKSLDQVLRKFIVTPDFHRVHHSVHVSETNSNFGFFLPHWDFLFGTYVKQPKDGHDNMNIGIGIFSQKNEQNFIKMWTQPFRKG